MRLLECRFHFSALVPRFKYFQTATDSVADKSSSSDTDDVCDVSHVDLSEAGCIMEKNN